MALDPKVIRHLEEIQGAGSLITVGEVKEAAERFVNQNSSNFPLGVSVEVLDTFIPGRAFLLLTERSPRRLRSLVVREIGVAIIRIAKMLDRAQG